MDAIVTILILYYNILSYICALCVNSLSYYYFKFYFFLLVLFIFSSLAAKKYTLYHNGRSNTVIRIRPNSHAIFKHFCYFFSFVSGKKFGVKVLKDERFKRIWVTQENQWNNYIHDEISTSQCFETKTRRIRMTFSAFRKDSHFFAGI